MAKSKTAFGPLRGVMVARYGSITAYANKFGKKSKAVRRTVAEGYKWKVEDAIEVCNELKIPLEQISIFFVEQG